MIDDDSENAFLDLLYGAVIEPNLWVDVMERLGDQIGGGPAILTTIDRETGAGSALTARVGSETVDNYLSYYAIKNPLLQSARHDDYRGRSVQKVVVDEQVVDRAAFVSSEWRRCTDPRKCGRSPASFRLLSNYDNACSGLL